MSPCEYLSMRKLVAVGIFAIIALAVASLQLVEKKKDLSSAVGEYEILNCSNFSDYRNYYRFDEKSKTLYAFVTVNCGSDEILVEKGEKIRIIEKDYDGLLARCVCQKEVRIYNVSETQVEFVNWGNESIKLEKETNGFCGISTFAECKEDADCKIGGCSGQVCMGSKEEIFTTCEYRDCYNHTKFGVGCKCVNNRCQWI
ncbi:MAG: eight-cysteine-cluster domain-containing protein [Archaeoglobaceae archaeon]